MIVTLTCQSIYIDSSTAATMDACVCFVGDGGFSGDNDSSNGAGMDAPVRWRLGASTTEACVDFLGDGIFSPYNDLSTDAGMDATEVDTRWRL